MTTPTTIGIDEVAALVPAGSTVIFGGSIVVNRPMAAVRELVRAGVGGLEVIATAGGIETELLLRAGLVDRLVLSHLSLGPFGVAPSLRAAVDGGAVAVRDVSGHVLLTGLDAAARGLAFLPAAGDLDLPWIAEVPERCVPAHDPFTGAPYLAVRRLAPDVAIIHADGIDRQGNVRLATSVCADLLFAMAATTTIVTYEVAEPGPIPGDRLLPRLFVDHLCHAPGGAAPTACAPHYDLDVDWFESYLADG